MEGILLVDKSIKTYSFTLVKILRKLTGVKKIGHAGTLDPLATGLMIMLIGNRFTKLSTQCIRYDKCYTAAITLGKKTDSFDAEGTVTHTSSYIPSLEELQSAISCFQGEIEQVPPMYSAKKQNGTKLYTLARKGITVERKARKVQMQTTLLSYVYPLVELKVTCSSGTYIRSLAHDLGEKLSCGAFLSSLRRTRIGPYTLDQAILEEKLSDKTFSCKNHLQKQL